MTGAAAVVVLLAAAVAVAAWHGRRLASHPRWPGLAMQLACALLLGGALIPLHVPSSDDGLVVWASGTAPTPWRTWLWPEPAVALPEATVPADVERAPDLETALRRHPAARRLDVRGDGLPLRDQAAAAGWPLHDAAAPLRGLLALHAPSSVQTGSQWSVDGLAAAPAVRAELRDPGGAVADAVPLRHGRFHLSGVAKGAGLLRFELRLLDTNGNAVDTAAVPLQARSGTAMTVIVRAGAPDPELKYWRRWAVDAGLRLQLAAALGPAMDLHDGDAALTPAALAAADLVVVDARAWPRLSADEVAALRSAVQQGLGVLLRCSGALDPDVAAAWSAFGHTLQPLDDAEPEPVTLDGRAGPRGGAPSSAPSATSRGQPDAGERITYTAAPVRIGLDAGTLPLLRSDAGDVLAAARDVGAGRVAVWRLQDSYRLLLAGNAARYGRLWSDTLAQVARPRPHDDAQDQPLPGDRWVGERMVACGLGISATVADAGGAPGVPLLVDGAGCAVDLPATPGWQHLASGGATRPFYVRSADDAAGLRRARDRAATLQLAARPQAPAGPSSVTAPRALPRWPFFLAWLVAYGAVLWRERAGAA